MTFRLQLVLLSACGAATPQSSASQASDQEGPICEEVQEPEHPSYTSDSLELELHQHPGATGMVIPPLELEVHSTEDISSTAEMELTIHTPNGQTQSQRFPYTNMEERCDPICDRVAGGRPCPPRQCRMERYQPRRQQIDPTIYRSAVPGTWTYVLHRLDNDERVSVSLTLFEGEELEGEACSALPPEVGPFRRQYCRQGVVPIGSTTTYWGVKARYLFDNCRANAFALPLSDSIRTVFDEGPLSQGELVELPQGTIREVRLDNVRARAWLSAQHLYLFVGLETLPKYDELVAAMVEMQPPVDGPQASIPTCDATGAVEAHQVEVSTLDELTSGRNRPTITTHFEGNRAAGVHVSAHNQHPLSLAGIRPEATVLSLDGNRVRNREAFERVLERFTRPGRLDLVVSVQGRARCLRITVREPAPPPAPPPPPPDINPPPPPPPPGPRQGRHCVRQNAQCWSCAQFTFPAELDCGQRCGRDQMCVHTGGRDQCLSTSRVCCMDGVDCNRPPGCDGVAISCASTQPGGRNERCTFLNTCAQPLPR